MTLSTQPATGGPSPILDLAGVTLEVNQLERGVIYLMVIYAKVVRGNMPAHLLKAIQETIEYV